MLQQGQCYVYSPNYTDYTETNIIKGQLSIKQNTERNQHLLSEAKCLSDQSFFWYKKDGVSIPTILYYIILFLGPFNNERSQNVGVGNTSKLKASYWITLWKKI